MIQIDHVSVSFGGLKAVDDVSFGIPKSRITGLIGPNGAGKTTMFNAVAGHVPVTSGRVLLEGEDITFPSAAPASGEGPGRRLPVRHEFSRLTVLENFMAAAHAPLAKMCSTWCSSTGTLPKGGGGGVPSGARDDCIPRNGSREGREGGQSFRRPEEAAGTRAGADRNPKIVLLDEIGAGIDRTVLAQGLFPTRWTAQPRARPHLLPDEHDLDYVLEAIRGCRHGPAAWCGTVDEVRRDERVIEAYFSSSKYGDGMSPLLAVEEAHGRLWRRAGHRRRRISTWRRTRSRSSSDPTGRADRRCSNQSCRYKQKILGGTVPSRTGTSHQAEQSQLVPLSISTMPQSRNVFPTLTVEENLDVGTYAAPPRDRNAVIENPVAVSRPQGQTPAAGGRISPAASARWWRSAGR